MGCGKPCDCPSYRDHLLSVGIGAAALPSRRGGVHENEAREQALSKDLRSYRNLRLDGLQPPRIDGSHRLEQGADHALEVEAGQLVSDFTTGG